MLLPGESRALRSISSWNSRSGSARQRSVADSSGSAAGRLWGCRQWARVIGCRFGRAPGQSSRMPGAIRGGARWRRRSSHLHPRQSWTRTCCWSCEEVFWGFQGHPRVTRSGLAGSIKIAKNIGGFWSDCGEAEGFRRLPWKFFFFDATRGPVGGA